jgi:hypothetical protein
VKAAENCPGWTREPVLAYLRPIVAAGHCWALTHHVSRFRYPCNDLAPVSDAELDELFWRRHVPIVSYFTTVTESKSNGFLYLCRDPAYSIDKLSANNRSKVRRGLKRFEVRSVTGAEVARMGYRCQVGTHERNLLKPMARDEFERHWENYRPSPIETLFAAVKGDEMGAFMSVRHLGTWVEIVGTSSATELLSDYPNHALMFTVLENYLRKLGADSVSYGLSSVQTQSKAETLHHFKQSIGYEAIPVTRVVRVHPVLRPVVGPWLRRLASLAERAFPHNRRARAAAGALKLVLDP